MGRLLIQIWCIWHSSRNGQLDRGLDKQEKGVVGFMHSECAERAELARWKLQYSFSDILCGQGRHSECCCCWAWQQSRLPNGKRRLARYSLVQQSLGHRSSRCHICLPLAAD